MIKDYLNRIVKDTGWVLILNAVNFSSSFIIAVFVSRLLGVDALGRYTFIVAASSIIYMLSDFGLTTSIVREIGGNKNEASIFIREANAIKTYIGTISFLIFIIAINIFDKKNFDIALAIGAITAFPRLYQASYEASIRVFGFQKYPTVIRSVSSLVQVVLSYLVIAQGYSASSGLAGVFIVILIIEIVTLSVFFITNGQILKKENISSKITERLQKESLLQTAKKSFVLFLNNVLTFTMPRVNIFLLEYISSTFALGVFSAGTRFVSGAGLISGALYNSVYPFLSRFKEQEKPAYELAKQLLKYSFLIGAAASIILYFLADILIDLTFKVEAAKLVLKISAFSFIPLLVYTVVQTYMLSFYMERFLLKVYTAIWLLNIGLGIVLIWKLGYIGAAIVTISIEYLLMIIQLVKFFSIGNRINDSTAKS